MKLLTKSHLKQSIRNYSKVYNSYMKIKTLTNKVKVYNKQKIFGIGRNKTGTSSLTVVMQELGYVIGDQKVAELFFDDWRKRDFRRLIQYCHTAEFFQDIPFSIPFTYIVLDNAFKGSKFILTVRDDPEQWYNSITKFHAKIYGKNGRIPTKDDLQNATYNYKGMPYEFKKHIYNTPEDDPYNKEILIKHYINYNKSAMGYFRDRPNDLLILNIAEKGAYKKLTKFLGKKSLRTEFPWVNKT